MLNSPKIQILLSTYNGEKYLDDLLLSLLSQEYANFNILIRDDGSKDNTLEILEKYKNNSKISIIHGENLGVQNSFFELLKKADFDADFIALCDQDDIWEQKKLERAVSLLINYEKNIPLLYCSRLKIVNKNLKLLKFSSIPRKGAKFENSLIENIATGCTIVINKIARDKLSIAFPKKIIMHDWWIYQAVSAMGKVIYDIQPQILYRQHENNVVGIDTSIIVIWKKRITRYLKNENKGKLIEQAKELQRIFGDSLSVNKYQLLETFIKMPTSFMERINYAIHTKLFRQKTIDDLIFRALIIFKKI